MSKLLKILAVSFRAAVISVIVDVLLLGLSPHNFLASHAFPMVNKMHLISIDFIFLFFIFLIMSAFLVSSVSGVRTIGLWLSMGTLVFYIISWATFFYTDQFIDIEGVRFFFHNLAQLLEFVFQTSLPLFLLFFAIVFLVPWTIGPLLHSWVFNRLTLRKGSLKAGAFIVLMVMVVILAVSPDFIYNPVAKRIMRSRLSPQATMIEDYFFSQISEYGYKKPDRVLVRWNKQVPLQKLVNNTRAGAGRGPVILIVVESMRSDILKDGLVMPNLFKLKQDSLYFIILFQASNESDYAWPAIMSSQYPLRSTRHYYYPSHMTYPRVMIYDVLKAYGYRTAIFSAQNEEWGNMRNYLDTGNLDVFFDANTVFDQEHPGLSKETPIKKLILQLALARKADDGQVVDHALAWMQNNSRSPFFCGLEFSKITFSLHMAKLV